MSTITRNLSNISGANVTNPDANSFTATSMEAFANDAAFEVVHGTGTVGDFYWNTTDLVVREHDGTAWQNNKFIAQVENNSTLTGANQDFTPTRNQAVRFSNASLTSIRSVVPTVQKFMILINATGAAITVNNEDAGATAANRIITGTGSNLFLANDASIFLQYDTVSTRWRIIGGSGSGGLFPTVRSTTFTAVQGFHYQTDTSGGAFTGTLPTGAAGSIIMFSDSTESWNLFPFTIAPASGQKIDGLANDETLVCDVKRGWVELSWNSTGSFWSMRSLSSSQIEVASTTQAGIVSTGNQSFAGIKTFNTSIKLLSTGATQAELDFYATQTLAGQQWVPNGIGSTASAGFSIRIDRVGKQVTLQIGSGVFNAIPAGTSTLLSTGNVLPSWVLPATQLICPVFIVNNGSGVSTPGVCAITTAGAVQLWRDPAQTVFTNAANAGLYNSLSFTYMV